MKSGLAPQGKAGGSSLHPNFPKLGEVNNSLSFLTLLGGEVLPFVLTSSPPWGNPSGGGFCLNPPSMAFKEHRLIGTPVFDGRVDGGCSHLPNLWACVGGFGVLSPLGPFIYLFSRPWVLASLALGKLRAGGPHSLDCLHKERLFGIDSIHSWNLPRPGRLPRSPWLFYLKSPM